MGWAPERFPPGLGQLRECAASRSSRPRVMPAEARPRSCAWYSASTHAIDPPVSSAMATQPLRLPSAGDLQNLKVRQMTPKFLREEAARFRGMADEHTREASKLRLMAMAADYEARATAAAGFIVAPPMEDAAPAEADVHEPDSAAKIVLAPRDTGPVARRPVGRPRLRIGT